MIEIIVDGKIAKERLFDEYTLQHQHGSYFAPKNDDVKKYCKFLKKYYFYDKEVNYLNEFFVIEIDKEKYKKTNHCIIDNDEIFLFEFPDDYPEEDLFYFKLKYC